MKDVRLFANKMSNGGTISAELHLNTIRSIADYMFGTTLANRMLQKLYCGRVGNKLYDAIVRHKVAGNSFYLLLYYVGIGDIFVQYMSKNDDDWVHTESLSSQSFGVFTLVEFQGPEVDFGDTYRVQVLSEQDICASGFVSGPFELGQTDISYLPKWPDWNMSTKDADISLLARAANDLVKAVNNDNAPFYVWRFDGDYKNSVDFWGFHNAPYILYDIEISWPVTTNPYDSPENNEIKRHLTYDIVFYMFNQDDEAQVVKHFGQYIAGHQGSSDWIWLWDSAYLDVGDTLRYYDKYGTVLEILHDQDDGEGNRMDRVHVQWHNGTPTWQIGKAFHSYPNSEQWVIAPDRYQFSTHLNGYFEVPDFIELGEPFRFSVYVYAEYTPDNEEYTYGQHVVLNMLSESNQPQFVPLNNSFEYVHVPKWKSGDKFPHQNLIANGAFEDGNYNWSFYDSYLPETLGVDGSCALVLDRKKNIYADEMFYVNANQQHYMRVWNKYNQAAIDDGIKTYIGFTCYDATRRELRSQNSWRYGRSKAVQDFDGCNVSQLIIEYNDTIASGHYIQFDVDQNDPDGYSDLPNFNVARVDTVTHDTNNGTTTLTFNTETCGFSVNAGQYVGLTYINGGTFRYAVASAYVPSTTEWEQLDGYIYGQNDPDEPTPANKFLYGTHFVKPIVLGLYSAGSTIGVYEQRLDNFYFVNVDNGDFNKSLFIMIDNLHKLSRIKVPNFASVRMDGSMFVFQKFYDTLLYWLETGDCNRDDSPEMQIEYYLHFEWQREQLMKGEDCQRFFYYDLDTFFDKQMGGFYIVTGPHYAMEFER